ncbi:MAG: ribosome-associated translation inhibitor RaiA [Candidatus Pacebacteria bacterium]|nr:ribosome-associated translation inhibitor RaiA [Candidatus Paceibacterota bacterium]
MELKIELENLDSTPSIKEYIEDKILPLGSILKKWEEEGSVLARFELSRSTNHHHKGDVYYAEVNLTVGGKLLRAECEGDDVHGVIDKVKDKIKKEAVSFKEKTSSLEKFGHK